MASSVSLTTDVSELFEVNSKEFFEVNSSNEDAMPVTSSSPQRSQPTSPLEFWFNNLPPESDQCAAENVGGEDGGRGREADTASEPAERNAGRGKEETQSRDVADDKQQADQREDDAQTQGVILRCVSARVCEVQVRVRVCTCTRGISQRH